MTHGGEEAAARLGRLSATRLAWRSSLLALELGDVLHHAVQYDPFKPLLVNEVTTRICK